LVLVNNMKEEEEEGGKKQSLYLDHIRQVSI